MSILNEFPLNTPPGQPPGKLYKRFTTERSIKFDDALAFAEDIFTEKNYYRRQEFDFKWIFETHLQSNQGQPIKGMITEQGYATIKTNSHKGFEPGDVVHLKWRSQPDGMMFMITDQNPEYIYTPNEVMKYQHLQLRKLM